MPCHAMQAHKNSNPGLKTLISIGGWSFSRGEEVFNGTGSQAIFPAMAASSANRAAFIASAISYAQRHGFDGIDMDW
jgi:chitinase